ncbi:MAG: helix-turn-helix transcriptional regulator [Planctomycetes bacterium]|nr:helix-turn-helix transcriptional regulator [Planctomycetota bacterium]
MADHPALVLEHPLALEPLHAGLFISRGQGIHPRRTIDSWEIIFVAGGDLHIEEAGRRFHLLTDQALLLRPGVEHSGTQPYAPECRFYWIHFQLIEAAKSRDARGASSRDEKPPSVRVPQSVTVARPDALTALVRRYLDDQAAGRLSPTAGASLITLMLCELAMPSAATAQGDPQSVLARHAHDLIVTRFHQDISTASIARSLGCNPDYLGRCYRAIHGHGIVEGIHRVRLQRARTLLLDSARPIDDIARACGFSDAIYFRRIFKRHESLTPLAYRKLHVRVFVNTE